MTGFGRAERRYPWGLATWELVSINHRFLDIHLQLPGEAGLLERRCRKLLQRRLGRGKVNAILRVTQAEQELAPLHVNRPLVQRLLAAAAEVEQLHASCAPLSAMQVLRWPGVCEEASPIQGADLELLLELLDEAVAALCADRRREGAALAEAIRLRCNDVGAIIDGLKRQAAKLVRQGHERMRERLRQLQVEVDPARMEQELALLLQKADVEEELDRIRILLEQMLRLLDSEQPIGKHLGFLLQELGREANTLGTKLGPVGNGDAGVRVKVLIEQVREQASNVE